MNSEIAVLVNDRKYHAAIIRCNQALEMDPNNVAALNAKGLALGNLGKYDEAISFYDKIIKCGS